MLGIWPDRVSYFITSGKSQTTLLPFPVDDDTYLKFSFFRLMRGQPLKDYGSLRRDTSPFIMGDGA